MTETNSCVEKDALIDYLYGEADAEARIHVEAHVRGCAQCADEVRGLRDVRGMLEAWIPPDAELGFRVDSDAHAEPVTVSFWGRLRRPPVWGLAAAAVLVMAAAIVKPELEIGRGEMVLRVGWSETGSEAATEPDVARALQSDLAPLGAEQRQEIESQRGTSVAAGPRSRDILPVRGGADVSLGPGAVAVEDEWLLRTVRQLIRESEQRQEFALDARVQQVEQVIADQRQADLAEMERAFSEFEVTGAEVARQQLLDALRRVSER